MATNLIYDFNIQYDNNELIGIIRTKFTKKDIIILDRGYSKLSIIDKLCKKTNFVIRLTQNLIIYKEFMKSNKDEMIISRNGHQLKIIKFIADNKTRAIIKERYHKENDEYNDNDGVFVLITNLVSLTRDELIDLYKSRWNIEVCNKYIKSNFNLRNIVRQQNSSKPIDKIGFYTSLSMLLYNITMLEKKLQENKHYVETGKKINLIYSNLVVNYKRFLIDAINPQKNVPITKSISERRFLLNKTTCDKKRTRKNMKKRGKYKSIQKMAENNDRYDILEQIEQYYKLTKQIKKDRQYVQYGG
jgi:hypothetical protein